MTWLPASVGQTVGRRYPHAPINEALFDVRAQLPPSTTLDQLMDAQPAEYPIHEQRLQLTHSLAVGGSAISSAQQQVAIGHLFKSDDGLQIMQSRLDGFSFSRLRPYEDWTRFSGEAFRLLDLYLTQANPDRLTRIALRYINQIDFPSKNPNAGRVDLSQYFTTRVEIAPSLPQDMAGFFMSLQIPLDSGPKVQITETSVASVPEVVSIVLDIDAFWEAEIPADNRVALRTTLSERFEYLRECKNAFFEGSITDLTRRLFE